MPPVFHLGTVGDSGDVLLFVAFYAQKAERINAFPTNLP